MEKLAQEVCCCWNYPPKYKTGGTVGLGLKVFVSSDSGKDCRQEEKGITEDEVVGWHHRLDGHEFEQAPGAGEGQGSLACCSPWDRRELDMTE